MAENSAIAKTMERLRNAVEQRDWLSYSREQFKVVNFCRRALFHGDRAALGRWYPEITSLLMWFYRSGKADWQEAERSMGGVELLSSLIGNFLETRSREETMEEVRRSGVDSDILKAMSQHRDGIRSGELAKLLGKSQNSVTNRFPGLEKMGLIVRSKRGKESMLYLTPKGKGLAGDLRQKPEENVRGLISLSGTLAPQEFADVCGQNQPADQSSSFWPGWTTGPAKEPTGEVLSV
jgi:DNA-binding MarR family transcriptional regulator